MCNTTNTTTDEYSNEACFLAEFSAKAQHEYHQITSTVTVPLNISCALWVTVGNLSIIISVAKIKELQLPSTFLLVSLVANDFLVGLVLQPLAISRSIQWLLADKFCIKTTADTSRMFFIYLCRCNALSSLMCLSIERYIAISQPRKYRTIVNKKRVISAIVGFWVSNLLLTTIVQFYISEQAKDLMKSIPFGTWGALIVLFQMGILKSYHHNNRILCEEASSFDELNAMRTRARFEKKAAITLVIILAALFICYLPIIIIFLIRATNGRNYLRLTTQWLELVLYLNSAVNPVIYFHRYTNLRREVRNILWPNSNA